MLTGSCAPDRDVRLLEESAPFARWAEAVRLELHGDHDRVVVVELDQIDVAPAHAGSREQLVRVHLEAGR